MIAFESYKNIEILNSSEEKCKLWLKDYEGLHFSIAEKGEDKILWSKEKELYIYSDKKFNEPILCFDGTYRACCNKIQRKPNRTVIEIDESRDIAQEKLLKIKEYLKYNNFGFIYSTHNSKNGSDYLWIEFSRNISDDEAEKFLKFISSKFEGNIDLNFASSKRRFPVLFASHWKYPKEKELPIEYFEGEQIDYDSLIIPEIKGTVKTKDVNGFAYKTFESETAVKQEIKFEFESETSDVKDIEELEKVIKKYFPTIWFETKACASLVASLSLKNLNGCPSLNLVGNPSGEKTTALSFFYNHKLSYVSDDFTPKSFVSHSANVKANELEAVDLLPKLKNRVLISPELAPLFEAQKDKLLENFAILTRVLDGEGLNRDSGVHGHRGYSGDYKFGWLGATTPLKATAWNVMGKIGNRLFFLNMRDKNRTSADYVEMFRGEAYEKKVKICRGAVKSFLDIHFKKNPVRSLEWDAEQDIFILSEIVKYAQLLSKLRGTLMIWRGDGEDYQHSFPIIEEPPRAINSLYNFAKGHALLNGRTFLKNEDLEIVRSIAFSSMPHDRFEFLKLLLKHEGRLTTQNIQKELNCSDETARKTMKIFEILGIVTIKNIQIDTTQGGRPMQFVEIKPEFSSLLKETQVLESLDKPIPSKTLGVYDGFTAQDFIKTQSKVPHTHQENGLDNIIPSETNPVCCHKCKSKDAFITFNDKLYCKQCAYEVAT